MQGLPAEPDGMGTDRKEPIIHTLHMYSVNGDHMGIRVYGDHSAWGLQYTMNELVEKTQLATRVRVTVELGGQDKEWRSKVNTECKLARELTVQAKAPLA